MPIDVLLQTKHNVK